MRITSIKLAGWRSFSPDQPATFGDLKHVNLIIGPNNAGKSNLVRFFSWLRAELHPFSVALSNGKFQLELLEMRSNVDGSDLWNQDSTNQFDATLVLSDVGAPSFEGPNGLTTISVTGTPASVRIVPLLAGKPLFARKGQTITVLTLPNHEYRDFQAHDAPHRESLARVAQSFVTDVINVEPLRHPDLPHPGYDNSGKNRKGLPHGLTTAGGKTLETLKAHLNDKANPRAGTILRSDVSRWLSRICGQPMALDPHDELYIERVGSGDDTVLRCHWESMGTGAIETVMLLVFLRTNAIRNAVVFLDEPEAHLHPAAALEFLRIIRKEFPRFQFFITTHSTALIDAADADTAVFRASMNSGGATAITRLETSEEKLDLLGELGIRPTQLFMSNCVVWVEGPSDVLYYERMLADAGLVRGRDFTFVMYGGSVGEHLTMEDNSDRLVRCFEVNPRNVVVCDLDVANGDQGNVKNHVQRLLNEAAKRKPDRACVLPLTVREVEDFVSEEVLRHVASEVAPNIVRAGRKLTVVYGRASGSERFHARLAASASCEGSQLDADEKRRVATALSKGKVSIARRVVGAKECFSDDGLAFAVKLKSRVLGATQLPDRPISSSPREP